eukprot:3347352-Pyramimonas_sp.AAC.1
MSQGLENLASFCWLRHPPRHPGARAEPHLAGGAPSPLRAAPDRRAQLEQGTSRRYCASGPALAQLDLSWLAWSITGSDYEARLGG